MSRADAAKTLAWLREVQAVRRIEPDEDGASYVVELATGQLLALPAEQVFVLHAGVLAGYRLPRSTEVLG